MYCVKTNGDQESPLECKVFACSFNRIYYLCRSRNQESYDSPLYRRFMRGKPCASVHTRVVAKNYYVEPFVTIAIVCSYNVLDTP